MKVLTNKQMAEAYGGYHFVTADMRRVCKVQMAQDEKEVEQARQEGIQEVVREINKRETYRYVATPSGVHLVNIGMTESWQAQLKKWGLDK